MNAARRQKTAVVHMTERKISRKLGILGGVGWASTAMYYEQLCRRSERLRRGRMVASMSSTLEMTIESLDLACAVSLLGREGDEASWAAFDVLAGVHAPAQCVARAQREEYRSDFLMVIGSFFSDLSGNE